MRINIEKNNGEWPEEVRTLILDKLEMWIGEPWQEYVAAELLDDLAALTLNAETPT